MFLATKAQRARRASTKRRMRLSYRLKKSLKQPYLRVQRTFWLQHWVPGATATNDFWRYYSVTANNLPSIGEFSGVFDKYKLYSFTITLRPRFDSFAGNDTTDTILPGVTNQQGNHVHVVIDPSSPNSPIGTYNSTTLNQFLENGKVRTYNGIRPIRIKVNYPCFVDDINNTAASVYKRCSWMSLNNLGVTFRGAHIFIQDPNLTGVFGQAYDVFITMDIGFKGLR